MRDKLNDPARIQLMLEAIANIESFLNDIQTKEQFVNSKITTHAVLYNLQCIGESVYKLSKDFISTHPDVDWEAIEGLRHVLVHDYYQVNLSTVWAIVEQDLPELKLYLLQI